MHGPPQALRASLVARRAAGEAFSVAWPQALSDALSGADDPASWAGVLDATRSTWSAAYGRLPAPRPELALVSLGTDPDRSVPVSDGGGICPRCGGALAPDAHRNTRFCSRKCQRAASGQLAA